MTTNNLIIWILISKKLKIENFEKSKSEFNYAVAKCHSKMIENDRKMTEKMTYNQGTLISGCGHLINRSWRLHSLFDSRWPRTILDKIINVSKISAPNLDKFNQIISWYYMKKPSKLQNITKKSPDFHHQKANKLKGLVY